MMRRSMTVSMYLVFPFLLGLIATAKPVIRVLLKDKWLPCVPFMQLTCIICMFWPLNARTQALNALGKSNVTMKLSIISKTMTVIMVLISIRISIYAMMISSIIASTITFWITSYYVNKYIGYSVGEVLKDIAVPLSMSAVMAGIVYCVKFIGLNDPLTLLIQIPIGIIVYILASKLLHVDSLDYILSMVKRLLGRKKEA
jgi:O-antigen/teichoic acid export membrane protein